MRTGVLFIEDTSMSWVREIRDVLDIISKVTDPVWQAEFVAQMQGLQMAADDLAAQYRAELAERIAKPPAPKPSKSKPKCAKPTSPDAATVCAVKNSKPQRAFVHSVPQPSLPRDHR